MKIWISAAAVAAAFVGGPALAKDMHCNMNKDYAAAFDKMEFEKKGTKYRLFVKDTYSGVPDSIHSKDYNKYVNVKWGMDKPSSTKTNVMVRPRSSTECVVKIVDEKGKDVWTDFAGWCNTSKHKETGSHFDMSVVDSADIPAAYKGKIYATGGATSTYNKVNYFLSFYLKKSSNSYVQIGGCVEDR